MLRRRFKPKKSQNNSHATTAAPTSLHVSLHAIIIVAAATATTAAAATAVAAAVPVDSHAVYENAVVATAVTVAVAGVRIVCFGWFCSAATAVQWGLRG